LNNLNTKGFIKAHDLLIDAKGTSTLDEFVSLMYNYVTMHDYFNGISIIDHSINVTSPSFV
jgi:hypothetical protein